MILIERGILLVVFSCFIDDVGETASKDISALTVIYNHL